MANVQAIPAGPPRKGIYHRTPGVAMDVTVEVTRLA